jgi:hypothetical protein
MALFGHAAICKLSLLSGVKRKLDFETTKGSFWRKAVIRLLRRTYFVVARRCSIFPTRRT